MIALIKKSHATLGLDVGILIFRVLVSLLMLTHGVPKLMKFFSEEPIAFADVLRLGAALSLGLTVFAEVICSVLLLFGLATRLALIPLIILMTTIVFHIHAEDPLAVKEKAILFLLSFLVLFFTGSGRYSLDHVIHSKNSNFKN